MNISTFWRRITTARRTLALEAAARMECELKEEIARLRAENRALLNSILGIAGVPPITVVAEPAPVAPRRGSDPLVAAAKEESCQEGIPRAKAALGMTAQHS